jgi:hypothetical protein
VPQRRRLIETKRRKLLASRLSAYIKIREIEIYN